MWGARPAGMWSLSSLPSRKEANCCTPNHPFILPTTCTSGHINICLYSSMHTLGTITRLQEIAMLAHVGSKLSFVGSMLAHVGPMLAHVGPMLAHVGPMLAHVGSKLGVSCLFFISLGKICKISKTFKNH